MAGRKSDFTLPTNTLDDLFSTQEERDDAKLAKIRDIPLTEIDNFPDHPFKVRDDEDKECTVCGYTMATETIPATGGGEHTHSYGSDWKNDATNHWHECSCGDKADKAAHDFKWVVDKEATATQKGSKHEECRVCGYKKAAVEIPATGTPTEPGKPTDSDSPQTGDNSNMILWIALLFVSGGVVIGITVYSKKKKENAE